MQGRSGGGGSQGESHLFASEKLFNSTCDLREKAPKSRCDAEYERREAAPASHARMAEGSGRRRLLRVYCSLHVHPEHRRHNKHHKAHTSGTGPPPADVRIAKSF